MVRGAQPTTHRNATEQNHSEPRAANMQLHLARNRVADVQSKIQTINFSKKMNRSNDEGITWFASCFLGSSRNCNGILWTSRVGWRVLLESESLSKLSGPIQLKFELIPSKLYKHIHTKRLSWHPCRFALGPFRLWQLAGQNSHD